MDDEIVDAFKKFNEKPVQTFTAKVTAVDKSAKTIEIIDDDEFDFDDVRLTSVIDDKDKVVKYPKLNSSVLVGRIGDDENTLFVIAFSEIESIEGVIDNTDFIINAQGYEINSDGENLKEVLNDGIKEFGKLCDEVSKIVVSIGTTPNVPVITQIKTKMTVTIKNRLNKILK